MQCLLLLLVVVALLVVLVLEVVEGVSFELLSTETRCVHDVLGRDTLATGAYIIQSRLGEGNEEATKSSLRVKVLVKSPSGEEIFSSHGSSSTSTVIVNGDKFAFVAAEAGKYECCFTNEDVVSHFVTVVLKSGVEARDLSEIAQHDHLKPLSVEILRLQQVVSEIRDEMLKMKAWEAEMRDVNELTNSRVQWFSMFSVFVVLTLGISQVQYLRNYLTSKKLI